MTERTGSPRFPQPLALIPAAAWLTLFFLVPLLIVLVISLMRPGAPVDWTPDGGAFLRLVEPVHFRIVLRSVSLAAASTLLCLLIGFPLAWYIAGRPEAVRRWLFVLVLLPLWANSLVLIYGWMVLLRPNGVIEQAVRWLGWAGPEPLGLLYNPGAVLLGLVYWYLPFMIYPLYVAIEKFDRRLIDAARDLGASRLRILTRVLLPLTRTGIITGSLLVFIESLGAFVVPDLLGGSKSLMLGNLIQQRFLSTPQDWPLGAAMAVMILVSMAAAGWLYRRLGRGNP